MSSVKKYHLMEITYAQKHMEPYQKRKFLFSVLLFHSLKESGISKFSAWVIPLLLSFKISEDVSRLDWSISDILKLWDTDVRNECGGCRVMQGGVMYAQEATALIALLDNM